MSDNDRADELTGAQSLVRSLERVGADVVFGIPGGAILPAYDPLFDSEKVRHILVRHEQGAGHAAEGYAMVTGRSGCAWQPPVPAQTESRDADRGRPHGLGANRGYHRSGGSAAIGTDAFQEADIRGITMPITKHSFLITDPADIASAIASAFHIAGTGAPGPVLVDIAKDALQAETRFEWPRHLDLPGYHPVTRPHGKQVREAAS
jgi:acetolactate synthase-1/2/3 large subunit